METRRSIDGKSMRDWGKQVAAVAETSDDAGEKMQLHTLSRVFSGTRERGWLLLEKLNLPRYSYPKKVPLPEFIAGTGELIPADANHNWFVLLEDKAGEHRYRKPGLTSADVPIFVQETITKYALNPTEYDIFFNENYPQLYGGNVIIDKTGALYVEFIQGNQGVMADGSYNPTQHGELYTVTRDPLLNSFKYSFGEEEKTPDGVSLRQKIYDTLMHIPHTDKARKLLFTPGYYEFCWVQKDPTKKLEPLFLDYHQDESFTISTTRRNSEAIS